MGSSIPILYVNHTSAVSGAEESLLALMSGLDREAFTPSLACPPGPLADRAEEIGVEVFPLPLTRFRRTRNPLTVSAYALSWVVGSNQLRRIVQSVEPKIIHANSATAQVYAGSAPQKSGIPSVWHARDLRRVPFPAANLCRQADKVIAISEAVAASLAGIGLTRPKVTCIYNGIDPEAWRSRVSGKDVRAELQLPSNARILLMAAQFVPWKRHEDAIRAMPDILKSEPDARLVLAGADLFEEHAELRTGLQDLCRELALEGKVLFVGHRQDIPDIMNAAEIILIPSDAEPFGRVAIEAMALGKPVVGTRAGGLPEVVRDGETGLLAVPRFPESLAEACVRILKDPTLAQSLGAAGRERVEQKFHVKQMAAQTQQLYQAVLHPPLKWIRG
jgi:glycosyltransferase involved in cell wall biosynthesis